MNEHQRIIRALLDSGLTQTELGGKLGKSQAWVVSVLKGDYKDIKWGDGLKLRKLATDRGVSVSVGNA